MNDRPFIAYIAYRFPVRVPLLTTRPTAFSPLSEQQPAEIRPTSVEVTWPVTAGLGVKVLSNTSMELFKNIISLISNSTKYVARRALVTSWIVSKETSKQEKRDGLDF
ncbi:hypothetical protein AVEN_132849-1 [Araneus ventricosus]|uniref:Uncharacterized protein n=1 Tax=Araneus ventricosus TaxID=182803 RepID=A0A4Y2HFG3_ARAVE|nr:hypothetical protein AVEN_132849-1 [Araneus ventricosus]